MVNGKNLNWLKNNIMKDEKYIPYLLNIDTDKLMDLKDNGHSMEFKEYLKKLHECINVELNNK